MIHINNNRITARVSRDTHHVYAHTRIPSHSGIVPLRGTCITLLLLATSTAQEMEPRQVRLMYVQNYTPPRYMDIVQFDRICMVWLRINRTISNDVAFHRESSFQLHTGYRVRPKRAGKARGEGGKGDTIVLTMSFLERRWFLYFHRHLSFTFSARLRRR